MSIEKGLHLLNIDAGGNAPVGTIIWSLKDPISMELNTATSQWLLCDGRSITFKALQRDTDGSVLSALYLNGDKTIDITEISRIMDKCQAITETTDTDTNTTIYKLKLPDLTNGNTIVGTNLAMDVGDDTTNLFGAGDTFAGNFPVITDSKSAVKSTFYGANSVASYRNAGTGAFKCTGMSDKLAGTSSHGGVWRLNYTMNIVNAFPAKYSKAQMDKIIPTGICAYAYIRAW